MYLNTVVLWTIISFSEIAEVHSKRFSSPRYLFSDEPNIFDEGTFYASQSEHERFARSIDGAKESSHTRTRRFSQPIPSNPVKEPEISDSKALCDHDRLVVRWTDTNLVTTSGAILALCRESSANAHDAAVFVSYDHGKSFQNITGKFEELVDEKPTIDMYYTVAKQPNFILFADKINKYIFYSYDGGRTIERTNVTFVPDDISINPKNPKIIVVTDYTSFRGPGKVQVTRLFISKDMGKTYNILRSYIDVNAFYWGDEDHGDKSTDLFIEAKKTGGKTQGYQLDCSKSKTCSEKQVLTTAAPLNGVITDFLVKGAYMFVTQENKVKSGLNLFVKHLRTGTFKKADIITRSAIKEIFVYDVKHGHVMLIVNHRVNETNLYNSLDQTGLNYSLSLPRVLYHNPHSEVSSHWLRSAVKYRFVDIRRVEGLPSVYFATQLTVGPVGGRYLISKMTFDKGGVWRKIKGPEKNKWGRTCHYPICSLHVNLLYGSIYRYSKTTPLMSRESAPGLLMATGVLGTNLKISPDTYLSRDGGYTFKQVLSGKRRFGFGDHGGFVLASDFDQSGFLQYSVDFDKFYHVAFGTNRVDIKKILTEPGERGVVFLVIGTIGRFYHIFQVNATRSLGRQCTENDYYKVNMTDVGIGGCAMKQIELRNSSTRCLTGKNYSRVVSITYKDCKCRRRHYQCDLKFAPDKRGSCVQVPGTNLVPSHCPEGQFFMQSRGYSKMPEYDCTEDNETLNTLAYAKTPCPVEKLNPALIKTKPKKKEGIVKVQLGERLHAKVMLSNGFAPHINFSYSIGDYKRSGVGSHHSTFTYRMNKTGAFVLRIDASNSKTAIRHNINVNVIRPLNASTMQMKIISSPKLPGVKDKATFVLQMAKNVNPREYGFPLSYKWRIDTFIPKQTTIFQFNTKLPTLEYTFNNSGHYGVVVTASNDVSTTNSVETHVQVTKDLKPQNVKLTYIEPRILKVEWDQVNEPGILRYRVQYREGKGDWDESTDCRPKSTETECEIANVTYNTMYSVQVDVATNDGYGPASEPLSLKIPSGRPEVPQNVRLVNKDVESLEATWQPPSVVNGKLIAYWYKFYKAGDNPPKPKKLDVKITNKVFDKLEQDVNYMFEIAAANEEKTGLYSEAKSARTGVDKPTLPPTGFDASKITATTATLTWKAPKLKLGSELSFSPKSYNIYMVKDGKMSKIDSASLNTYSFTKLNPNTKYDGAVSAVADKGEGPQGSFSFTTLMGPPEAPVNLKATAVTFSEATLTWSPASADNVILSYTVYQLYPDSRRMGTFSKTTGKVKDLRPYTQYKFAVSASNKIAESDKSENCTFTTAEYRPERPGDMTKDDLWPESSSINVTWLPPKVPNGKIIKYTVSWHPEKGDEKSESAEVSTGLWLRVDHLRGETYYLFQVQAWTSVGIGAARSDVFKTIHYPYGSQSITIPFEEKYDMGKLFETKNFKKNFIAAVAERGDVKPTRIADVRLNVEKNAVVFELISKEDLQDSPYNEILDEMDKAVEKLQRSFTVNDAKTINNGVTTGKIHPGEPAASGRGSDGGSSNLALIVGLVCAAVIIALLVVLVMMFLRYRRKSLYNKFDNQFQYNHDDDSVRYVQSSEVEMAHPSQKHRHKDIETVPLADADELT